MVCIYDNIYTRHNNNQRHASQLTTMAYQRWFPYFSHQYITRLRLAKISIYSHSHKSMKCNLHKISEGLKGKCRWTMYTLWHFNELIYNGLVLILLSLKLTTMNTLIRYPWSCNKWCVWSLSINPMVSLLCKVKYCFITLYPPVIEPETPSTSFVSVAFGRYFLTLQTISPSLNPKHSSIIFLFLFNGIHPIVCPFSWTKITSSKMK